MCAWCINCYMDATKYTPEPQTLQEAIAYFADPERCFQFAKKLRWPDGQVVCPRCGVAKNSFIKTRRLWFCYSCKKQFTIKVKTIMEDSPIGLDKWMAAFWLLANCRNGISSHELRRTLGVTQTTAWFMLHRIREVMGGKKSSRGKMPGGKSGEFEVDEAFIGPVPKNMHRGRRMRFMREMREERGTEYGKVSRTAVQGMLSRDLREIRAKVVPNVKRETLQEEVLQNIPFGSTVYTDNAVAYDKLKADYVHGVVNHAERYVDGRIHTNGLENFWSLLKRTLRGTYVAVEPFHLDGYLNEQVFRFNNRKVRSRKVTDKERFTKAMSQVFGHRLTYTELTGKDSERHETAGTRTAEPF
jgi:transposase-like protein